MGKNKNKKKGKGAEKTTLKTDKKLSRKREKELAAIGEENIENILAEIQKEENDRLEIVEVTVPPPSRRSSFSFIPHPDKDELILFGGEFFNGQKTSLYNDLFFYSIPNNSWKLVKAPKGPPPRCSHQLVASSSNNGQLWLFGGEFTSPTQSQFYHYRDLWVYQIATKKWEKIQSPNGPSARSGHRMVLTKKQLIVFGGFHDTLNGYKYFNDLYSFNTESYSWMKLEATGTAPVPRSGCCMVPLLDGRILIHGGYSKEKIKKDVDKGHVYTDTFLLTPDKNDPTGTKWKWSQCKTGGVCPSTRCGMSMVVNLNNYVYSFGGVFDTVDDDENLSGVFFNDLYSINLEKLIWKKLTIGIKKDKDKQDGDSPMEIVESLQNTTVSSDGVFTITINSSTSTSRVESTSFETVSTKVCHPSSRMNCGLAIKRGVLYLYGGMLEDGDKQLTFNDFYALDLKKLDEWKAIIVDDLAGQEWLDSDSSGSASESEESDSESSED